VKTSVPFLLALLLLGCTGVRPEPPVNANVISPQNWRTSFSASDSTSKEWWKTFNDPILTVLIDKAMSNNVDIAIAAERVTEARAQFRLINGQRYPNVGIGAGVARERSVNAFGQAIVQNEGQVLLSASYDADLFGRVAYASEAAKASILATDASRDTVALAVLTSTATGYINLRALDARLLVLKDTLKVRAESLRIAKRRADTGYSTKLEREQAEAEYHATEQQIPIIELAITRQEDALSILLGENPGAIERGNQLYEIALPPINAGLPSELLRRRPDIYQAEQQIVAADRSLDAARAAFMPNIQLSADAGYVTSSLLDNPVRVFSIGGSILAPLFQGGRLHAQADQAASKRDQAAFNYRKTVLSAFKDVDDSIALVSRTAEQEQYLIKQRDALARALTLATKRYKGGYSPYIEQLDAQRGLLSAELALIQARADQLNGIISLFQALGGGWEIAGINRSQQ